MKIAAGIVGILIGITSIIYIGLIGGMLGSATSWLGSGPWAQGDTRVNDLGQLISLLSYLSGLLAIIGGIVAFSNPLVAGIILAGSAFSHWYLLGFGVIGKVFILPIATAAFFAFFSSDTKQKPVPSYTSIKKSDQTGSSEGNATTANFDRAKWDALVKYDKDIALIAEKLQSLGQKWLDEFASSYLAINDKTYLPEIEKKIIADAKIEAEINEIKKNSEKEQRKIYLQEQARLAQEHKEKSRLWRDRLWGKPRNKMLTVTCVVVAIVILTTIALWPKPQALDIRTNQMSTAKDSVNSGKDGVTSYQKYIIQNGAGNGNETYFGTVYVKEGAPTSEQFIIGGWGDYYYDFIKFNLDGSPSAANTISAKLYLYGAAPSGGNDPRFQIDRITENWTATEVNLTHNPSSMIYKNFGSFTVGNDAWNSVDITDLYKNWKNGIYPNYGIKLVPTNNDHSNGSIASSNNTNSNIHPKIEIVYSPNQVFSARSDKKEDLPSTAFIPLESGTYINKEVACDMESNATRMVFNGRYFNSGYDPKRVSVKWSGHGSSYVGYYHYGNGEQSRWVFTVKSPTEFVLTTSLTTSAYRLCRP